MREELLLGTHMLIILTDSKEQMKNSRKVISFNQIRNFPQVGCSLFLLLLKILGIEQVDRTIP